VLEQGDLIVESGQQTQPAPDLDGMRAGLHTMWNAVAPGWAENAGFVDERGGAMTDALLSAADVSDGDRVLELACGPGGLGLEAARRFPDAEVVLSDVAEQMVAVAEQQATDQGITNVSFEQLDLERIEQPDDSYDVVLCREGIMLVPEPARAAAEIRRVLRPGGRVALSVWASPEQNPWLTAMLQGLGKHFGGTFPPPGMPGPLSLGSPERLRSVLAEGGLEEIEIEEVEVPWVGASFEEWWERTAALAGPVAKLLEAQPPEAVDSIRSSAHELLARYETGDGLVIPGTTLVAGAR
jgi:2-polyprenyl-3-methyl-5-hydroxy-6-metoxy-1,4-benzoquinol methylase